MRTWTSGSVASMPSRRRRGPSGLAGDRSAWVDVVPDDPVEVTVHDSPSTQIAVRVPIDVASEWLEENRLRLARVRAAVSAS
ncbi:DUF5959 family protein [Streptomyces sp. UP1A-1]|nr:DUF5959 family protein [Streptomyces sp. UP1A-1]